MTISSTTVKNSYSGDSVTTTFTYTFKIFQDSDIQVIIRSSTGTETTKTITTHYTVTGAGVSTGGSVIFTGGNIPTTGQTVVLRRNIPQTQAIDYIANDPFPAESHEEGLDRSTMAIQQLQEEVTRAIKLSRTNTMTSTEFTVAAADRANKILAFDSTGEISVTQELGTFKGNWATATSYAVRDLVKDTSTNNIFIVDTAHTSVGSQPLTTNANSAFYELIVDADAATTSATAAAASAATATTQAALATTNGAAQVTLAAAQVALATTQATNASNSATTATTQASNASTSATAAAASAASAAVLLDTFDDIYLGAYATNPTLDNDGGALTAGDLYFNTASSTLQVYSGSVWQTAAASTAGFATLVGVETFTNKTLTSPKIGTSILDTNGNELALLTATASAVNELTITNSATANAPEIAATGSDTNIDLKLTPKGTGKLNLDGIKFPNADGVNNQILKTDGAGALSFINPPTGFRNIVINGDMNIAQRSTSVASITAGGYYTVDRMNLTLSSLGTWTQSQSTDVPTGEGFATSLKMDCTTADATPAAGDVMLVQQRFEGQNLQYLKKGTANAVQLTASFYVKSTKTGTFVVELEDADNTRSVSGTYTVNTTNTWEEKSVTFPADTTGAFGNDNGNSLGLNFWLGAGTTWTSGTLQTTWGATTNANRAVGQVNIADNTANDWLITGVQLEAGTSATDFEFLPIDVSLGRCQRYFISANSPCMVGNGVNDFAAACFPVIMRASPTMTTTTATTIDAQSTAGFITKFGGIAGSGYTATAEL